MKSPGKGTGCPAPSPQIRTCGTPASGSSVLILSTKSETIRTQLRLAHNIAALLAILDGVDDPGLWEGKFVHDRVKELLPVNVAFVGSTTQPVSPVSPRTMQNDAKSAVISAYTIIMIVATELDA